MNLFLPSAAALGILCCTAIADVTVSNVRSVQRAGTKLVDIDYDLSGSTPPFTVSVRVSSDDGASFTVPVTSLSGAFGAGQEAGTNKRITWNAGVDWYGKFSSNVRFEISASDADSVVLDDIANWNFFESGDSNHYTEPVPDLFQVTPQGVEVRTDDARGGGAMISKQAFMLTGRTLSCDWSSNGGGSFMDIVIGQRDAPWPDAPGLHESDCVNASAGNTWAGSWLAEADVIYRTVITFTTSTYSSVTQNLISGATMESRSGSFDYSSPVYLVLRNGDVYMGKSAYFRLKSLNLQPIANAASSTALSNRAVVDSRDLYPVTELKAVLKEMPRADGRRFVRSLSQKVALPRASDGAKTFFLQLKVPKFSTSGWGDGQSGLGVFYGLSIASLVSPGDVEEKTIYYKFGGSTPSAQTPISEWKPTSFDSVINTVINEGTYYFKIVLNKGEGSVIVQASHQSLRLCKPNGDPVMSLNPGIPLWLVAHGKGDGENTFRSMNAAVRKGIGEGQVVSVDWANGAAELGGKLETLDNGMYFINLGGNFSAMLKSEGFAAHKNVHWVGHSWGTLIGYETARAFGGVDRFFALDPATQALGGYDDGRVNFGNISLRSTSVKGGGTVEGPYGSETKARTCDFSIRLFSEKHTGDKRGWSFYHSLPRSWFIRAMNEHTSDVYWPFFHDKLLRTAITPDMPWGNYKKLSGFDVECHGDTGYADDKAVFMWHNFLRYQTLKGEKMEARAMKQANGSLSWSYK